MHRLDTEEHTQCMGDLPVLIKGKPNPMRLLMYMALEDSQGVQVTTTSQCNNMLKWK